jgi:hypothetical protein
MGTTLTGTTPQDTYDSLIKVTDNGPLSGTAKYLSDGLGNDSVLALSTAAVGVGTTSNSYTSAGRGNLNIAGSAGAILGFQIGGTPKGYVFHDNTNLQLWNEVAGDLLFGANATERMRITSAGVLDLNQGQIKFPATQVASADANTLDDYEEGTWTPVINGAGGNPTVTYAAGNTGGIYTKIGNQVTISFEVRWTALSGGSGAVTIGGLPFARRTTTLPDGDRLIIDSYDNTISGKYLTGNVGSGNSSIALSMVNSAAAPTDLVVSNLSTSGLGFLRGTVTYFV